MKNLLLISILLTIIACGQNEIVMENVNPSRLASNTTVGTCKTDLNYYVDKLNAEKKLRQHLKKIKSKRADSLKLTYFNYSDHYLLKSTILRDDRCPELHIFNFKDNKGFAIMSSDKRTPEILVLSEKGNISQKKEIRTPIENYILEKTSIFLNSKSSLHGDIEEIYGDPIEYDMRNDGCKVKWCQTAPFSSRLPKVPYGGGLSHQAVSSVTVAAVQLMSIYEFPKYSDNLLYWWYLKSFYSAHGCHDDKNGDPNESYWEWRNPLLGDYQKPFILSELGRLMKDIGDKIKTKYGYPYSSAWMTNVIPMLKNEGYKSGGVYKKYDGDVVSDLKFRYPVIISAHNGDQTQRHAWLAYGLKGQKYKILKYDYGTGKYIWEDTITKYYIKCNYGFSGYYDGWYLDGIFNTKDDLYNWTSNTKALTGIRVK